MSFITDNFGQFAYFDAQFARPDWRGKRVLDFGGNTGNILKDPRSTINPNLYWCVDVSRDAVAQGRRDHPEAHFTFYDLYSYEFNPTGTQGLELPDVGGAFDYVLLLSVFTHMSHREMLWFLPRLLALLKPRGTLAFTILDPNYAPDEASATNLLDYALRGLDVDDADSPAELVRRLGSDEVLRGGGSRSWTTSCTSRPTSPRCRPRPPSGPAI